MFKTRLLSGIILVALALILIISGGEILLVSTAMISMIGQYELYRVFHVEKKAPGLLGYLFTACYFADLEYSFLPDLEVAVIVFLILLLHDGFQHLIKLRIFFRKIIRHRQKVLCHSCQGTGICPVKSKSR